MTPREFYESDHLGIAHDWPAAQRFDTLVNAVGDANAQDYIRTLIHSDLATEPERTNVPYGLQNYLMNDPAYMRLYSIDGGNEQLTRELTRRLDADVRMGSPVTSIGKKRNGAISVTSLRDGQQREDDFDFVVVALPNNYLPQLRFEGSRLAEAMKRHHAQYDFPAHYLRITILFERPFWRSQMRESFVMLDRFGGCCLYDESLRQPGADYGVLGWLLGGQAALEMSPLPDTELIARALDSLPDFLNHGRRFFLEGRAHRFINAVNGIPGGLRPTPLAERHQPEPVEHPQLFVVGDYLFDSTLNGVLDSAHYVSNWIAALMAEKSLTKV
jgi:monoamine oxidase